MLCCLVIWQSTNQPVRLPNENERLYYIVAKVMVITKDQKILKIAHKIEGKYLPERKLYEMTHSQDLESFLRENPVL